MLDIWTVNNDHSFGIIEESNSVILALPVASPPATIKYSIISGSLPPGLRISGNNIVGTPFEVPRLTEFKFVIRASNFNTSTNVTELSDRAFSITIDGSDQPVILNNTGALPIGANGQLFILDSSYVDFQIDAIDNDTAVGQKLRYFISSGDGDLPPGLSLTEDGRIQGFIQPLLSIPVEERDGSYGNALYDQYGYDYGLRPDNGYDSFLFDSGAYDLFLPSKSPRKLNRNYEFILSITDGDTVTKRQFKIFVVGDDFLRADNTITSAGNGVYTADGTYLRSPIWTTDTDLGLYRANNYVTIFLDVYEAQVLGPVFYQLDSVNPDSTPSVIPPNLQFDPLTSELYGIVPYQPAVIKNYRFTVTASRYGTDNEIASTKRTFTIKVLGEVNSTMAWETPSTLPPIDANYISTLKVEASSTFQNPVITYNLVAGSLPPGLTLQLNGEITGKVNQYSSIGTVGMTTFSDGIYVNQTFDGGTTSIDREFKFVIRAHDQAEYSNIDREFNLRVNTPNDRLYSSIYIRAFMDQKKRFLFNSFVNDNNIFSPELIYRPNDLNFGIQRDMLSLVYAGIETKDAARFVSAMGLNHKRKSLIFGDVKTAKAKLPGTNNIVYEVIYVELLDPLEPNGLKLNSKITHHKNAVNKITADTSNAIWDGRENLSRMNIDEPYLPRPNQKITVDQTNISVSDPNAKSQYPSSISIWRERLKAVGLTERNYLPLWMRSVQDDVRQELGFVLAMPICYCKPGTSDIILTNINFNKFDFKNLDFTVDRYIIDAVTGYGSDKYLVFKNDGVTI